MFHHYFSFFFFNDTATTEIYTLSLHDALPICNHGAMWRGSSTLHIINEAMEENLGIFIFHAHDQDRKSTRLNSSHTVISYAVFCLKKKKQERLATTWIRHGYVCCMIVMHEYLI